MGSRLAITRMLVEAIEAAASAVKGARKSRPSTSPRSARPVSNMKEPQFVRFDRPIDEIGMAADGQRSRRASASLTSRERMSFKRFDRALYRKLDAASALWASRFEIFENVRKIGLRPPRIADDHSP